MSAIALLNSVQQICNKITGGVPILHDLSTPTVRVMDCVVWNIRASAKLRSLHPNALIGIEVSIASISGFVVIISEPKLPHLIGFQVFLLCVALFLIMLSGSILPTILMNNTNHSLFCKNPKFPSNVFSSSSTTFLSNSCQHSQKATQINSTHQGIKSMTHSIWDSVFAFDLNRHHKNFPPSSQLDDNQKNSRQNEYISLHDHDADDN